MSVFGRAFGSIYGSIYGSIGVAPAVVADNTVPAVVQAAIDRLRAQFRDKEQIVYLLTTLAWPAATLETVNQQLINLRTVDNATGAQLDRLGRIVGQARDGNNDGTYRRYIRARIAANRSTGIAEDIITISRLVLNDPALRVHLLPQQVATLEVSIEDGVPATGAPEVLISILRRAVAAGVRVLLRFLTDTPDESFTYAIAAFATGSTSIGATTIVVDSTAGFPDSGELDVDFGLAIADVAAYTGRLSDRFLGVTGIASNHTTGCPVTLRGGPGKGYGDSTDASVGGAYASVLA